MKKKRQLIVSISMPPTVSDQALDKQLRSACPSRLLGNGARKVMRDGMRDYMKHTLDKTKLLARYVRSGPVDRFTATDVAVVDYIRGISTDAQLPLQLRGKGYINFLDKAAPVKKGAAEKRTKSPPAIKTQHQSNDAWWDAPDPPDFDPPDSPDADTVGTIDSTITEAPSDLQNMRDACANLVARKEFAKLALSCVGSPAKVQSHANAIRGARPGTELELFLLAHLIERPLLVRDGPTNKVMEYKSPVVGAIPPRAKPVFLYLERFYDAFVPLPKK